MLAHTRKQGFCRTAAVILGAATALWLMAYWAADSIFASVASTTLSSQAPGASYSELPVPVRSSGGPDAIRTRLEQLSEPELKSLYARCSQESIDRRLDGGEAIACSIGYDVLLTKYFAGDFERFLFWSRASLGSP